MYGRKPNGAWSERVVANLSQRDIAFGPRLPVPPGFDQWEGQAVLERDGTLRVVITHRDPGVPNWLNTAGHREGLFFCRWLQANELAAQPTSKVVPLATLARSRE